MTVPTADAPLRHPEKAARPDNPSPRKPPWIRTRLRTGPEYTELKEAIEDYKRKH